MGLTAGEGVAGDDVVLRWSAPGAAAPRPPAAPPACCLRCSAGPTMFSRKKRELMKTPSISKKNRAGSPSPQPSGVSEPLRGGGAGGDLGATGGQGAPSAWAAGPGPRSNMPGLRWGAHASYSPHQAGLQGPRRSSRDPGIRLMVGGLWGGHGLPHLAHGRLWGPGGGVAVPAWGRPLVVGSVGWGSEFGAPVLLDVRAMAQRSNRVPGCKAARPRGCTQSRVFMGLRGLQELTEVSSPGIGCVCHSLRWATGAGTLFWPALPHQEVGYPRPRRPRPWLWFG